MKQSLQLRIGQTLAMTPQLQQAIRLLQLSSIELQAEVQEALDSNMMLEAAEGDEDGAGADTDAATERDEYAASDTALADASSDTGDGEAATVEPADIPDELPTDSDWDDIYDSMTPAGSPPEGAMEMDFQRAEGETLHEHLRWQLDLSHIGDTDRLIAHTIVDSIDDDGYLRASVEELLDAVVGNGAEQVELDEVEAVLRLVQSLDPPGVGARDLRESLLIQLRNLEGDVQWREMAMRLVANYLDVMAARDYPQLMRLLGLDKEELQGVIALIQSLSPRPGSQSNPAPAQYVVPDVFVRKQRGAWKVELNTDAFPRLRVNPYYASLIRRADSSSDNTTMRGQLQEARWFIKSLKSRSETLLKVATCIVERQEAFLEHGDEAMKPMVLHDVAETVGMHESTISRVTTQKYMHTPRGIYELKYFFSSHVATASGGEASSTAIRALLKKLIAAEDTRRPLSDSKLADILAEQGINVARRTVAKYREAMAIPSSSERKCLI